MNKRQKCTNGLDDYIKPSSSTSVVGCISDADEPQHESHPISDGRSASQSSDGLTQADELPETTPAYGTQEYWEERYERNMRGKCDKDVNDDEPETEHAWYFTYEELKPLLLPLICGRDTDEESLELDNISENAKKSTSTDQENNKEDFIVMHRSSNFHNPKRILEIGCGDVPLGRSIYNDLCIKNNVFSKAVIESIICTDYSENIISTLSKDEEESQRSRVASDPFSNELRKGDKEDRASRRVDSNLLYEVCDARKLPYKHAQFHLVIDKGTLDAMLSDKDSGKTNCIKIVSEAARVLQEDGYLVIISHLNANTDIGIEWVNEVLLTGLKDSCGTFGWKIEVHGGDNESDDGKVEESSDTNASASSNETVDHDLGPAVYIIKKCSDPGPNQSETNDEDDSNIEIEFFGY